MYWLFFWGVSMLNLQGFFFTTATWSEAIVWPEAGLNRSHHMDHSSHCHCTCRFQCWRFSSNQQLMTHTNPQWLSCHRATAVLKKQGVCSNHHCLNQTKNTCTPLEAAVSFWQEIEFNLCDLCGDKTWSLQEIWSSWAYCTFLQECRLQAYLWQLQCFEKRPTPPVGNTGQTWTHLSST